ncbi:MAG: DUF3362 domain-containing protein [Kiritimatiellia bacterium]
MDKTTKPKHHLRQSRSSAALPATQPPLPMTAAEMRERGWAECDIILITGDAYVDHPSFGCALIGRWLEFLGYRVGVIARPNPQRVEDFRVLGRPRLCWGITAGNVDSELALLTVMRKRRRDDPYAPGGLAGARPRNASIVYTACARQAYKGVPVILGGVESSLRRFPYYDFWTDRVRRSILFDAKADVLVYGMGERALAAVMQRLAAGQDYRGVAGTAAIFNQKPTLPPDAAIELPSFEEISCADDAGRRRFMEMARLIEARHLPPAVAGAACIGAADVQAESPGCPHSHAPVLLQACGTRWLAVYPPAAPLTTAEMDQLYSLPFTRRPHPHYHGQRIPAFDMIKNSVTIHRGCYGACRFCALRVHQGANISSRSISSISSEIQRMAASPGFDGVITDMGGPSVNMFGSTCALGAPCRKPAGSCVYPTICRNLRVNHPALIKLLRIARAVPGVRHVFIAGGVRCDLALLPGGKEWLRELVEHGHVGGRLKIAPEHIVDSVLDCMGKPPLEVYQRFVALFKEQARAVGARVGLTEYFISGHPGCTVDDMRKLVAYLKAAGLRPEQVQDYYPAPMTMSAAMFYTGLDPATMQPIHIPRSDREKAQQRALLLGRFTQGQGRRKRSALPP